MALETTTQEYRIDMTSTTMYCVFMLVQVKPRHKQANWCAKEHHPVSRTSSLQPNTIDDGSLFIFGDP